MIMNWRYQKQWCLVDTQTNCHLNCDMLWPQHIADILARGGVQKSAFSKQILAWPHSPPRKQNTFTFQTKYQTGKTSVTNTEKKRPTKAKPTNQNPKQPETPKTQSKTTKQTRNKRKLRPKKNQNSFIHPPPQNKRTSFRALLRNPKVPFLLLSEGKQESKVAKPRRLRWESSDSLARSPPQPPPAPRRRTRPRQRGPRMARSAWRWARPGEAALWFGLGFLFEGNLRVFKKLM